jgi:hypothetical protein
VWRSFCPHKRATKRLKDMKKILFIRLMLNWPSLYRSQSDNGARVSALQKQREIVKAMIQRNALVHTEPVRR